MINKLFHIHTWTKWKWSWGETGSIHSPFQEKYCVKCNKCKKRFVG